jgi:hypothetical protein
MPENETDAEDGRGGDEWLSTCHCPFSLSFFIFVEIV